MMIKRKIKARSASLLWFVLAIAMPSVGFAHTGTGSVEGFWAGWLHPLTGLDHLAAMLAVGLWAAFLGGAARWRVPATFLAMLACGTLLGLGEIGLPLVEPMIVASVLVLGLLLMLMMRLSMVAGMCLVGLFALFHGYAHGTELPTVVSAFSYLLGLVLASLLLHLIGVTVGSHMKRHAWLLRAGGTLVAGTGFWLLVG